MTGALLDPKGNDPVAITEEEHQTLRTHLNILRHQSEDSDATYWDAMILDAVISVTQMEELAEATGLKERKDYGNPLTWVVRRCIDDNLLKNPDEDVDGALVGPFNFVEAITDSEMKLLKDVLKTVRNGGWFAQWLTIQVHYTAASDEVDLRYPSPLRMMANLTDAVREFEHETEIIRTAIERRPDMIPAVNVAKINERASELALGI